MAFPTQNKKKQPAVNNSLLESLRELSGGVGKSVVKDVAGGIANDAFSALFGGPSRQKGEMYPGQEYPVSQEQQQPQRQRPEFRQPVVRAEEQGLKQKIEAVRQELAALAKSIKQLNTQIERTVSEVPVDPGVYHLNFFERLRSTLRLMRQQVDDSRTWLAASSGRKKKMGYWGMYKKHGTTFGLSQERTAATQAG